MRAHRVTVTCVTRRMTPLSSSSSMGSMRAQSSSSSIGSTDGAAAAAATTTTVSDDAFAAPQMRDSGEPQRVLYPRLRMRARDALPTLHHRDTSTTSRQRLTATMTATAQDEQHTLTTHGSSSSSSSVGDGSADAMTVHDDKNKTTRTSNSSDNNIDDGGAADDAHAVRQFLARAEEEVECARQARNAAVIPLPTDPDTLVPLFRRVRHNAAMQEVVAADGDYPTFARHDAFVALPPPPPHPWVPHTPHGPFVVHGDGQPTPIVGCGEVGFEDDGGAAARDAATAAQRRRAAGLRYHSVLQRTLPQGNGVVASSLLRVQHSFRCTGRGVFATRAIARGQVLMVVQSSAQSLGVKGEVERLEEMCVAVLRRVHAAQQRSHAEGAAQLRFLHEWVLTNQPSSLLEYWPAASTRRVVDAIGGGDVLAALQLLPPHIARLAAVMDLCSFLVESCFAERKGAVYFAEAAFYNHSCVPNVTYDILPEHMFVQSEYYAAIRGEGRGSDSSGSDSGSSEGLQPLAQASTATRQGRAAPTTVLPRTQSPTADISDDDDDVMVVQQGQPSSSSQRAGLTAATPPTYLFCCRADRDIAAGEELLISYVPPSWRYDNRQYVLLDHYGFRCRCDACAMSTLQSYTLLPRFVAGVVVFVLMLQFLLKHRRTQLDARTYTGVVDGDNEASDDGGDKDDDDDDALRDSRAVLREARAQDVRDGVHTTLQQHVV